MIKINGDPLILTLEHFNDNTLKLKVPLLFNKEPLIDWRYEDDSECMQLYFIVNHIREIHNLRCRLFMPYIPNARMDRTHSDEEVFTMKWFAKFINSLDFAEVVVLDPHSNVATALIDRVQLLDPLPLIHRAIDSIGSDRLTLFAPDEGAVKRYDLTHLGMPYLFGAKNREWDTRELHDYKIIGDPDLVHNHDILIVDDIYATGGTMRLAADYLHTMEARHIYAYATHCENNRPLNNLPVEKLFTTDSIHYHLYEENVEVFSVI